MKILIVDDDPKYRSYVSRGLEESGLSCEAAADGETALEMLRRRRYDLVLLDVMLPGMHGWEVMEALRAEGVSVPVI
jgi:DNA-binding response OmpR family regulator